MKCLGLTHPAGWKSSWDCWFLRQDGFFPCCTALLHQGSSAASRAAIASTWGPSTLAPSPPKKELQLSPSPFINLLLFTVTKETSNGEVWENTTMHFRTQTLANICKVGMAGRRVCVCRERVHTGEIEGECSTYIYIYLWNAFQRLNSCLRWY